MEKVSRLLIRYEEMNMRVVTAKEYDVSYEVMRCSRIDNGLLIPTCDLVKKLSSVHIRWINYWHVSLFGFYL